MQLFKTQTLDLIWFAFNSNYISESQFNIYMSISKYTTLTPKQQKAIYGINKQIDERVKADGLIIKDICEHSEMLIKEMNEYLRKQKIEPKTEQDKAYEYKQPVDSYFNESYYKG